MTTHGGKRAGAGRPKGSRAINSKLRAAAQAHTHDAVKALVEVLNDASHSQRVKAAQVLLERGHGTAKDEPASVEIINQFMDGELTAIAACLMLEAEGLKVPEIMRMYFNNEMDIANFVHPRKASKKWYDPPDPLPRG